MAKLIFKKDHTDELFRIARDEDFLNANINFDINNYDVLDISSSDFDDIKNGQNIGLIVQSGCNYFSSFEYPENINAGIRVTKIGKSSVRYEVGLFKEKEELSSADGFFIHVYVDRKTNKPFALNYDFKNALDTIFVETEV